MNDIPRSLWSAPISKGKIPVELDLVFESPDDNGAVTVWSSPCYAGEEQF